MKKIVVYSVILLSLCYFVQASGKPPPSEPPSTLTKTHSVRDNRLIIGDPNAPAKMFIFVLMGCSHCQEELSIIFGKDWAKFNELLEQKQLAIEVIICSGNHSADEKFAAALIGAAREPPNSVFNEKTVSRVVIPLLQGFQECKKDNKSPIERLPNMLAGLELPPEVIEKLLNDPVLLEQVRRNRDFAKITGVGTFPAIAFVILVRGSPFQAKLEKAMPFILGICQASKHAE
ncbi:MAG: hypothetical protein LBS14_00250 [Holosporaceae bacterium]|jgi:hypothetical protein|nr:hypothetical protein [Holosporaceae bacterium]